MYRQFNSGKELDGKDMWVRRKDNPTYLSSNSKNQIISYNDNAVIIVELDNNIINMKGISYKQLFDEYMFVNGEVCGVKI